MEQFVNTTTAAGVLGVSRRTIIDIIHAGKLPAVKFKGVGRGASERWRIRVSDLENYVREMCGDGSE